MNMLEPAPKTVIIVAVGSAFDAILMDTIHFLD